ncbi:MAG: NAD(P)/FAD-dependent oxidoreductase [Bacteroidia bacterium]
MDHKRIIVIGGGAAGFFAAINAAEKHPAAEVIILEKSSKLLSKVRISGGGRCNVTHHCFETVELIKNYPRGHKELRQVFSQFDVKDTIAWFEKRGVNLKTESDGRMFPVTDSSETVVACFLSEAERLGIQIRLQEEVTSVTPLSGALNVRTGKALYLANAVICSTGGHHSAGHYKFISAAGHAVTELIPSLFTINLPGSDIKELMGLSVQQAAVKVSGTPYNYSGPVLITHWGLSGPAVLKLSAFAAKAFYEADYHAEIRVNWAGDRNEEEVKDVFSSLISSRTFIGNTPLFEIPMRLWEYLLEKAGIPAQKPWIELGKKQQGKLAQVLTNDVYQMQGKTTFKEEFVTSGGVALKEIDFKTMQSRIVPGLYFCGEVLDIDGITGGFNFQNAWSTAWIAASHLNL